MDHSLPALTASEQPDSVRLILYHRYYDDRVEDIPIGVSEVQRQHVRSLDLVIPGPLRRKGMLPDPPYELRCYRPATPKEVALLNPKHPRMGREAYLRRVIQSEFCVRPYELWLAVVQSGVDENTQIHSVKINAPKEPLWTYMHLSLKGYEPLPGAALGQITKPLGTRKFTLKHQLFKLVD